MKFFKHEVDLKKQLKEIIRNPGILFHKFKVLLKLYKQTHSLKPALSQLKGKENLVGAEIGVFRGDNARNILRDLDIKKLYLIDPYTEYYEESSYDSYDFRTIEKAENEVADKLRNWEQKIEWLKDTSDNAVERIPDQSLDFIYIDGDHSCEQVKKDIENYTPKVKEGGLISGHDYRPEESHKVADAVDQFVNDHNLSLHVEDTDWWFWK